MQNTGWNVLLLLALVACRTTGDGAQTEPAATGNSAASSESTDGLSLAASKPAEECSKMATGLEEIRRQVDDAQNAVRTHCGKMELGPQTVDGEATPKQSPACDQASESLETALERFSVQEEDLLKSCAPANNSARPGKS